MTIVSKLKLENASIDQLDKLRSCFLNIASILDQVAIDVENLYFSDIATDEVMDAFTQADELISKVKA